LECIESGDLVEKAVVKNYRHTRMNLVDIHLRSARSRPPPCHTPQQRKVDHLLQIALPGPEGKARQDPPELQSRALMAAV